uniref:Conserved secreted protein n=1 Tax=Macrostomum lignano TaxID=282301 RepID=A0A1I8JAY3_9PLAT
MKFIVFLLCCAAVAWTFAKGSINKNADFPEELIQGSYFVFNGNSSETHECLCSYGDPSEFDYSCELSPKTFDADLLPALRIPCDEIPYRVAAHLSINCSGCRECVTLDLRQLTLRHDKTQMGVQVYPPPAVNIFNCQVISANVDARQLQLEKVNLSDKMKVAQFGIPERPGVGGYYTVEVTYPNNFNESDC